MAVYYCRWWGGKKSHSFLFEAVSVHLILLYLRPAFQAEEENEASHDSLPLLLHLHSVELHHFEDSSMIHRTLTWTTGSLTGICERFA